MSLTLHLKANSVKFCQLSTKVLLTACVALGLVAHAHAQNYPTKRLSMVVPWPAGGANDSAGRLIANDLQSSLGQPVIVENSVGAGGSIGTTKALKAPADGYTLLLSSQQDLVLGPFSYKSANFKADEAQTVALLGHSTYMVVARPSLPVQTLSDLVTLMKATNDKPLSYCTPGVGTIYQLIVDRMNTLLQTKNLQVPYPGFGQCLTDLVGGRIDFAVLPIAGPFPDFVETGKIRGLAVLSDKPNARFPKMPLANATKGLESMNFSAWMGVHVNSAVPAPIVEQLNKAVLAALAKPEVRKSIEATGASIFEPMTPQQAHAYYLNSAKLLGALAQAAGLSRQ